MPNSAEHFVIGVMSGQRRGIAPSLLRGIFRIVEPFYSSIVSLRNRRFERGKGVRRLPRPVISVGNITAGGTGKTPVVQWLCEELHAAGHHPAILLRGDKSANGSSDEQRLFEQNPHVVVKVDPDRFRGGSNVLATNHDVDIFVLDDGFQHRKLARNFDLVLIDATQPFGFGHVHPRGLLREPLAGLARTNAILISRSDEVDAPVLESIEQQIRLYSKAPIYHATHAIAGFTSTNSMSHDIANKRIFAFCGIGNPTSFITQLQRNRARIVGTRFFGDHHAYSDTDLQSLKHEASAVNAEALVTTEKDWTKLSQLPATADGLPIWRAKLSINFRDNDAARLLTQIKALTTEDAEHTERKRN